MKKDRDLTEKERSLLLAEVARLESANPRRRAIAREGFVGGAIVIGVVASLVLWLVSGFYAIDRRFLLAAGVIVTICGGIAGAMSSLNAARLNRRLYAERAKQLRAELETGVLTVISGTLRSIVEDRKRNREHPPVVFSFDDGEVVEISSLEMESRGLPMPKARAGSVEIAMTPRSNYIVTIRQLPM